ncbi:DUF6185 family protein [Streptomyces sp. NPDC079167]|uniref:DUF6185 family protein n=1 Tax=Streptomyces sp. NPDC079167 TaxID=3154513 RepID=UPI003441BD0B
MVPSRRRTGKLQGPRQSQASSESEKDDAPGGLLDHHGGRQPRYEGGGLRACAIVLLALLLGGLALPGQVARASDDPCGTGSLTEAQVSTSLQLEHERRTQTKLVSRLTVRVPSAWQHATGLLLGEDSGAYRQAMRCLLRGRETQYEWWTEWRSRAPRVTEEKGVVEVRVDTYAWADGTGVKYFGPWDVEIGKNHWRVRLNPADALRRARWTSVVLDPGSASALTASPRPTGGKGDTGLLWQPKRQAMPTVDVRIDPAWQRSWAAQGDRLRFLGVGTAGQLLWESSLAVLLLAAARRTRRAAGPLTADETAQLGTVTRWAWVFLAISVVNTGENLLYRVLAESFHDGWASWQARHGLVASLFIGWTLLLFGRPRRTVHVAGAVLTVPALAVAARPESFGLPVRLFLPEDAPDRAVVSLFTSAGCAFGLLLLGTVATGWHLSRAAGLIKGRPSGIPGAPGIPRELRLRHAVPTLVLAVVVIGLCLWFTSERDWQRASWLSAHGDPAYGTAHLEALRNELTWFADTSKDWWLGYDWILVGLAILTVLRARTHRPAASAHSPGPAEELWLLLFFPVMVGMGLGWFTGNGALSWLWLFVNLGALWLGLALGKDRAVLDRLLQRSGTPLGKALDEARRHDLLDRARRFREVHAKLRRLDQGQSDDEVHSRRAYERELRGLHHWRTPSGAADRLPADVSVVDAALALGPRTTWWENGCRAAVLAGGIGLPVSALMVWSEQLRGEFLTSTLYDRYGLPSILMNLVYWEVAWAGAGFLLGAFWRRLPGRRGPARSLPITAAFALPIGIDAVGNWITREGQSNLALSAAAMLLVMTLTGMAIDLSTFQGERRYWQSRFGLLLSIYQMRYFSLQMAYLFAQLIAFLTLWQFFTGSGGPPEPPGAGTPGGTAGN